MSTAPRFTIKEGPAIVSPRTGIGGIETCFRVLDAEGGIVASFWRRAEAQAFIDEQAPRSGDVRTSASKGSYPNADKRADDTCDHAPAVSPQPVAPAPTSSNSSARARSSTNTEIVDEPEDARRMHNGMTAAEYAAGMATVGEYAFGPGWLDDKPADAERNAVARKAARR